MLTVAWARTLELHVLQLSQFGTNSVLARTKPPRIVWYTPATRGAESSNVCGGNIEPLGGHPDSMSASYCFDRMSKGSLYAVRFCVHVYVSDVYVQHMM
jgi:hypothetical protein